MAEGLLRGRQRRYFGYPGNTTHKIDTPESAKSYRSLISIPPREARRKYIPVKSFRPEPSGLQRFADKIIHRAVKTQIPGLLPPLSNSPQFDTTEGDNAIVFRSPFFEKQRSRSLYNFWLPPEDRREVCGIFKSHLKPDKRTKRRAPTNKLRKASQLTGLAAETAMMDQLEYLDQIAKDPELFPKGTKGPKHRRPTFVPSRVFRMNRKYQTAYWNPTVNKHLSDPYRRLRGKLPASEAICHDYFEDTSLENRDVLTCVEQYKARYASTPDLTLEKIPLEEKKEHLKRKSLYGTLEDEAERRGIQHIKQIREYDNESNALWKKQAKLMISATEYLNKLKHGRRFPTPPREVRKRRDSDEESVDVDEYLNQKVLAKKYGKKDPKNKGEPEIDDSRAKEEKKMWKKHRHFHHTYGEDFYMEMYLHFLNPEADISLKVPPKQLSDVKEVRRKLNLDEDPEKDKKLLDLIRESNLESLQGLEQDIGPQTFEEIEKEKEELRGFIKRLKNPRLVHALAKMVSQASIAVSGENETEEGEDGVEESEEQKPVSPISDEEDDDDLDVIGDIPENELKTIMNEIASESDQEESSSDDESSESSYADDEDAEGGAKEDDDDETAKLFKKAKKKKDSLEDLMDLSLQYRQRICDGVDPNYNPQEPGPIILNPFKEAVCILYPEGSKEAKRKRAEEAKAAKKSGELDAEEKK